MKPHLLCLSGAVLFAANIHTQDNGPAPAVLPPQFRQSIAQSMLSTDAGRRQAAYRAWLQLGSSFSPAYREALAVAETHHSQRLNELCRDRSNPYKLFNDTVAKLETERKRVMELIRTDWKKDPAKVKMLRLEMSRLEKLWNQCHHQASAMNGRFDAMLDQVVAALVELGGEQARLDDRVEIKSMDAGQVREQVMSKHAQVREILAQRGKVAVLLKQGAGLTEMMQKNAALGRWASAAIKKFANILNKERVMLGLNPLRLDEKLSVACSGHGRDMITLKFYAHESPAKGKKTPMDRARLAGFEGHIASENIHHGADSPEVVYDSWFASDGHRFNYFCFANALGVGISGPYWIMMCGHD